MPCICQYFIKDKKAKEILTIDETPITSENSESSVRDILTSPVSASELASLKAEVWSLKSNMLESTSAINNLQNVIKQLVEEKYQLLEELNESKKTTEFLRNQCCSERDLQALERKELINEIYTIKMKLDERENLLEKVTKQNIELKVALQEANETIYNMGLMFLKMKGNRSDCDQQKE